LEALKCFQKLQKAFRTFSFLKVLETLKMFKKLYKTFRSFKELLEVSESF